MLKKIAITGFFILALIFTGTISAKAETSENYPYFSIGYEEPMFNFSGAIRIGHFGMEMGFGFRSYPGVLDYPCPHYNYTVLDERYESLIFGVDLLRYFDLGDNCSIYLGAGVYLLGYDKLVQSNDTDWVYREYTETKGRFAYSGGLHFHQDKGFGVGVGYHTIRGYNLQMLFRF